MSDTPLKAAAPPKLPKHLDRDLKGGRLAIFRHPLWVRITHWIVAFAVLVLVLSGLQILKAHPHLYWGWRSNFGNAWIDIPPIPDWVTLPPWQDLAMGRRWHFFFAWIFVVTGVTYLVFLFASRRLETRLAPTKSDLKGFWHSVKLHAQLKFPRGEQARRYNVIQKMTYLAMIFFVLPMMLLTGLSMSPGFNATGAGMLLLDIFGGRQSARTLHFISASLIVLFVIVHVGLVIWTGLFNNLRAMITGWFVIPKALDEPEAPEGAP